MDTDYINTVLYECNPTACATCKRQETCIILIAHGKTMFRNNKTISKFGMETSRLKTKEDYNKRSFPF